MKGEAAMTAWPEAGEQPKPNAWLSGIKPYVGGEGGASKNGDRVVKLSSNENPMGPSPRAVDAFRRAADFLGVYPDGGAGRLRGAIAAVHEIDPDRIVCGSGSDELIGLLCQAYCAPGDEVIHTEFAFAMYKIYAQAAGATPVAVPERNLRADPEAILRAITPKTRIIFLANPNNPTGTYLSRDVIEAFVSAAPTRVLLVLDGAYAEYMREADYEAGAALVDAYPNVVMTRSFSKIHGLAAMRLGWAYGPATVIDALNRVRGPFNVTAPTLAAGEAAVQDADYTSMCAIQNEVWRDWLTKELRGLGIETPDSYGNFLLPYFGETGPTSAAAADAYLRSEGLIVRRMESYGLPGHLRITIGAGHDNVAVARAIAGLMSETSA